MTVVFDFFNPLPSSYLGDGTLQHTNIETEVSVATYDQMTRRRWRELFHEQFIKKEKKKLQARNMSVCSWHIRSREKKCASCVELCRVKRRVFPWHDRHPRESQSSLSFSLMKFPPFPSKHPFFVPCIFQPSHPPLYFLLFSIFFHHFCSDMTEFQLSTLCQVPLFLLRVVSCQSHPLNGFVEETHAPFSVNISILKKRDDEKFWEERLHTLNNQSNIALLIRNSRELATPHMGMFRMMSVSDHFHLIPAIAICILHVYVCCEKEVTRVFLSEDRIWESKAHHEVFVIISCHEWNAYVFCKSSSFRWDRKKTENEMSMTGVISSIFPSSHSIPKCVSVSAPLSLLSH